MTLSIENDQHQQVVCASSARTRERSGHFAAGDQAVFAFSLHNILGPGRYYPTFTVTRRGSGLDVIDRYEREFSFVVTASDSAGGMIEVPVDTRIARAAPVAAEELRA